MNKKILKEILKTESVSFSYEEIQQILDEELEKSADEMDTQLIDLCIDVLSKQEVPEKEVTKTHRKISSKKLLLIAALICILAILAIPVSAELPAIESQGGIVKVLENYISVNLTGDSKYNLSTELQNYGIPIDLLPSRFFESDCVVTDVQLLNDNSYRFDFELTNLDSDGYILVSKFTQELAFGYNYADIYAEAEQLKQLTINGLQMVVYSTGDEVVKVFYQTESFNFDICICDLTFNEVIKIFEKF